MQGIRLDTPARMPLPRRVAHDHLHPCTADTAHLPTQGTADTGHGRHNQGGAGQGRSSSTRPISRRLDTPSRRMMLATW